VSQQPGLAPVPPPAEPATAELKLLGLLKDLAIAVAEAADFDTALTVVLEDVCRATGWTYGQGWVPDPDGRTLVCSPA